MLATDALDGPLARRTGTAGPLGARLDMEADAALLLAISMLAALVVGPWALTIGLMRYAYVAASWVRPARLSLVLVAVGLGLLVVSFGRDVLGQERAERRERLAPRS